MMGCSTIAEVAAANNLTILVAAVEAAGGDLLTAVTSNSTEVTVFAPTDAAFMSAFAALNLTADEVLGNKALLTEILEFHISTTVAKSKMIKKSGHSHGLALPTMLYNGPVAEDLDFFMGHGGKCKVMGYETIAKVVAKDVKACKSVIQVIDKFLIPDLANLAPCNTLASVATDAGLTTLRAAVEAAGGALLSAVESNTTAVTVFAPTNKAFATLLASMNLTAEALLADQGLLSYVLSFHISPEIVLTSDLMYPGVKHGVVVPTLFSLNNMTQELDVFMTASGAVQVMGYKTLAEVLAADVYACRSVIQVIDQVLVPDLGMMMGRRKEL